MTKLKPPTLFGAQHQRPLQTRNQRLCERMLRQRLEEMGVWTLSCRRGDAPCRGTSPAPVSHCPSTAQPCPEPLQSWETPLLLRGTFTAPKQSISSERKRSRGERSKRKGRRGRGTKGRGSCAPALPELCSPGNSFLLMTAPISVGSRELVPVESWGGREAFTHLHGWQKPEVLKPLRKAPVLVFNVFT